MFAVIGAQSHRAGRRRRSNVHDLGFGVQDRLVQTHLIVIVGRALESLPGLPVMLDRGENRVGLRSRESAPLGATTVASAAAIMVRRLMRRAEPAM